ncbi:MAG: thioredoxin fold domain-containing protein [Flavobacteriaceae bacterium]|nr:thioredoxin fold domain-containing protein [Flavobacteriaceae bacterium]
MKKLSFLFILLISISINAQKINWMSLEDAVAAQKTNPKKIMIDAYTTWCGPCKMLDKNTFGNTDVAAYVNKNYYAVKFNAEGNKEITYNGNVYKNPGYDPAKANRRNSGHQLASYFGVRAYPTIIFLDTEAKLIAPITGYQKPSQLEIYLKMFHTNAYKNIETKEDYSKYMTDFSYTFKE